MRRSLPAGTGQTELQVRAAVDIGTTCYAGTPDFLKVILDRADEMGEVLSFTKAVVGGGALFPSLRQMYADRGSSRGNAMPPPIWAILPMKARRWRG